MIESPVGSVVDEEEELEEEEVAESGRLRPSGAAGANFLGGAVWGVFRENANCGDPPG